MRKRLGVIPVLNEDKILEEKVLELHSFLLQSGTEMDIVISDNASDDRSPEIARSLAESYDRIYFKSISQRGKWNAIKYAWLDHDFDNYSVFCFIDTDMATGPEALPRMFNELDHGADIVIGSRYLDKSDCRRTCGRLTLSRGFVYIADILFRLHLTDLQCGFKGISAEVRDRIVPFCEDGRFFMDTELLVRARDNGYRISEIPVRWRENAASSVHYSREVPSFLWKSACLKYEQMKYGLGIPDLRQ